MTVTSARTTTVKSRSRRATSEPAAVRWLLIGTAMLLVVLFFVLPLVVIAFEALGVGYALRQVREGTATLGTALGAAAREYAAEISSPATWEAIQLTLLTAAIAVPLNLVFGVAAAWAVTKFKFPG